MTGIDAISIQTERLVMRAIKETMASQDARKIFNAIYDVLRDPTCPICGGDCSAANPPVMNCPLRDDR